MKCVFKAGKVEIWHDTEFDEFYAYVGDKLIRTCPSIGMAHEVTAGY